MKTNFWSEESSAVQAEFKERRSSPLGLKDPQLMSNLTSIAFDATSMSIGFNRLVAASASHPDPQGSSGSDVSSLRSLSLYFIKSETSAVSRISIVVVMCLSGSGPGR